MDVLFTCYTEAEEQWKKALYILNETILTNMTENRTFDAILDCCIEQPTQVTIFKDAIAACALSSFHFTQPVASFVHTRMDKTAKEWR